MNVRGILHRLRVPHATVCQLADVLPTEMSAFLRSRRAVSETKAARIESITEELRVFLEEVWPTVQNRIPFPFPLDLKNAAALREMLDYIRNLPVESQAESEAVGKIQNLFDALGAER
jgi:hypothetical protein